MRRKEELNTKVTKTTKKKDVTAKRVALWQSQAA